MSILDKTFFEIQRCLPLGMIFFGMLFLLFIVTLFNVFNCKFKRKETDFNYFHHKKVIDINDFPNYDFRHSDIFKRGAYAIDSLEFHSNFITK